MIYAGIGGRDTPQVIKATMTTFARGLGKRGMLLRSGGARGADEAFEAGCDSVRSTKEIFFPYRSRHPSAKWDEALVMAEQVHPNWPALVKKGEVAQLLMARNCFQILGSQLDTPARLVICWTANGSDIGGTGNTIRLARKHGIPVVNLKNYASVDDMVAAIKSCL